MQGWQWLRWQAQDDGLALNICIQYCHLLQDPLMDLFFFHLELHRPAECLNKIYETL